MTFPKQGVTYYAIVLPHDPETPRNVFAVVNDPDHERLQFFRYRRQDDEWREDTTLVDHFVGQSDLRARELAFDDARTLLERWGGDLLPDHLVEDTA